MRTAAGRAVPERLRGLRFRWSDPALEADYRSWRADRAVPFVRAAMYGSAVGWAAFAVASLFIGPHMSRLVVPAALLGIAPLLAAVVLVTHLPRARRWSLQASAVANVLAGLAAVALLHQAGVAADEHAYADIGTAAVVLFVYYGCTIMRLPPLLAATAITPYVTVQGVLMVQGFAGDPARQAAYSAVLWIAVMSGLLLAAVLDRVTREAFRQERVIAAQQEVIEQERARSDRLLLSILPAPIADRLKAEPGTIAESHAEATVVFADVVGFTALASRLHAKDLVELLNDVFSRFDELTTRHGVEKIKTIGDSYMAVAGLPTARPDHVEAGADLALALCETCKRFSAERGLPLDFRLGMHSGPVIAGVIGTAKFAYDLWGDTVNIAARMESHGVPGQIQVTDAVAERLRARGYRLRERGLVDIKGKGSTRTWFLEGSPDGALTTTSAPPAVGTP